MLMYIFYIVEPIINNWKFR